MNTNFVYVPQHLYGPLKKAGLRGRDWVNIEKLLSTLSAEDVAFYMHANLPSLKNVDGEGCPVPEDIRCSLNNWMIDESTSPIYQLTDDKYSDVKKKLNDLCLGGKDVPPIVLEGSCLTSDCMEEDVIIITHAPKPDPDASEEQVCCDDEAFYDRFMQQLLLFNRLQAVLALPVFKGWMRAVKVFA